MKKTWLIIAPTAVAISSILIYSSLNPAAEPSASSAITEPEVKELSGELMDVTMFPSNYSPYFMKEIIVTIGGQEYDYIEELLGSTDRIKVPVDEPILLSYTTLFDQGTTEITNIEEMIMFEVPFFTEEVKQQLIEKIIEYTDEYSIMLSTKEFDHFTTVSEEQREKLKDDRQEHFTFAEEVYETRVLETKVGFDDVFDNYYIEDDTVALSVFQSRETITYKPGIEDSRSTHISDTVLTLYFSYDESTKQWTIVDESGLTGSGVKNATSIPTSTNWYIPPSNVIAEVAEQVKDPSFDRDGPSDLGFYYQYYSNVDSVHSSMLYGVLELFNGEVLLEDSYIPEYQHPSSTFIDQLPQLKKDWQIENYEIYQINSDVPEFVYIDEDTIHLIQNDTIVFAENEGIPDKTFQMTYQFDFHDGDWMLVRYVECIPKL